MATSITNTSISTDTINVDNGVLYVDNVNNRVGVNKTDPVYNIDVVGRVRIDNTDTNASLYVTRNAPTAQVTTDADIVSAAAVYINGNENSGTDALRIGSMQNAGKYFIDVSNYNATANYDLLLQPLRGNVGINTTNATAPLHVKGATSTSATAASAMVKIQGGGGDGLAFGAFTQAPYASWIQSGYLADGYSPEFNNGYPLTLNPRGGAVTMPHNPAFYAYKNGHWTEVSGANPVTSWTIDHQVGSGLVASTGRFTATVAGTYYFALNVMSYNLSGDTQWRWYKNGTYYAGSNDTGNGSNLEQVTCTCVMYLSVGDYAEPYTYSSATSGGQMLYNGRYSHISGFLIG